MPKMKQCYTCGYEERILSRVVYCVHCEETMVHRYCMDPPRHGDEDFDWVCEECCPRVNRHSKSHRISEYLSSKLDSEAEKRKPRRRLRKLGYKSHGHEEDANNSIGSMKKLLAGVEALEDLVDICDDQLLWDEEIPEGFTGTRPVEKLCLHSASDDVGERRCELKAKENLPGTNRTSQEEDSAVLEKVTHTCDQSRCSLQTSNGTHEGPGQSLEKDQDPAKRSGFDVNKGSAAHQPTLGAGRYQLIPRLGDGSHKLIESFLPISNVSWRGTCCVTHAMHRTSVELDAHLSNSANFKVSDAARTLPLPLDLVMVDKSSEWPKRFCKEPPCGDDIGLYFFPSQASDRKAYDDLLGKMIVGDLLLRFTRSDLRLLVFSSLELPKGIQRFDGKYFLWGVFSAPLSLPSCEKASVHHQPVPGRSSGSSCLEEDHANNRRSCSPTGAEVQSVQKGRGSSDTIQPTQQNAHSSDQRDSGRPLSSPSRPVSETETRRVITLPVQNSPNSPQRTCKSLKPAGIPHQADLQEHDRAANGKRDGLQNPSVLSNPDTRIEGGKDSTRIKSEDKPVVLESHRPDSSAHQAALGRHRDLPQSDKKRRRVKAEFPDQRGKLDAPGNFRRNPANKANDLCKRNFNRFEKGNFKQQYKQNFGFPAGKQKKKNKQKQKQRQFSPCKMPPLDEAPKPGSRSQGSLESDSHYQPCTTSRVEHSMPTNESFSPHPSFQSNPHRYQDPSFSHHEMPINRYWNEHSHPQPCASFPGGQHAMPVTGQLHPQPYASFPGGQHAMPGQSHPRLQGSFPEGWHDMPETATGQLRPQPYASFPGGQHAMPVTGQSHPQPQGSFPGSQHDMPETGQSHPQPQASFPGSQHDMPETGQSHPQPQASFPGDQHAVSATWQSYPQPYASFSGGQHTIPVAGQSHFQPYSSFPGGRHAMPVAGQWHPEPYASFPSGQHTMWRSHPQPHENFPGGQQATLVVGQSDFSRMQALVLAYGNRRYL